jgi:hypothetical protein
MPIDKTELVTALEREASGARWRAVLVSRLLPAAPPDRLDDASFREGYLRREIGKATDGFTRELIAGEMVRQDVQGQWPFIEQVFLSEKMTDGSDARIGILKALGEAPHTPAKVARLVQVIDDPRNESLLTQENRRMGMDMYRYWCMRGLNEIAGREVVPNDVEQGFKNPRTAKRSLEQLRMIAHTLLPPG